MRLKRYKKVLRRSIIVFIFIYAIYIFPQTMSKYYSSTNVTNNNLSANAFYFESDILSEAGGNGEVFDNKITFNITNSKLGHSSIDNINYSVKVKNNTNIDVTNQCTITGNTGTLTGNTEDSDSICVSVPSTGTYTIYVETTSPYVKVLSVTIDFMMDGTGSYYSINNFENYVEVILKTGEDVTSSTQFTFNIDSTLTPDELNNYMAGWSSGTSEVLSNLEPKSVYLFVFVKNVAGSYSKGITLADNNELVIP